MISHTAIVILRSEIWRKKKTGIDDNGEGKSPRSVHRKTRNNWKKEKKRRDVTIHGDLGREKTEKGVLFTSKLRLVGSGD